MRKLAHADCVVKIIHLFRHKAQSGQREILFPDIFPRLLNWVMDFLLQITSKVFQFIELAHQLCLYNTPERLAVFSLSFLYCNSLYSGRTIELPPRSRKFTIPG